MADGLCEGDAGEDFEHGRGEIGIAARAGLRPDLFCELVALDLRCHERDDSIHDAEMEADGLILLYETVLEGYAIPSRMDFRNRKR